MAIPSRRVFGVTLKSEFSFIYIYLVAGISLLIAVFLFTSPASAQSEEAVTGETGGVSESAEAQEDEEFEEPVSPSAAEEPEKEESPSVEAAPEEANEDEQVTHEDLEVKDAQVLPDSPLYRFKRFGRGLKEAFTFNPVKKAERRLHNANQELFDAQKLLERSGGDETKTEAALDAIGRFEEKITKINERIGGLQLKKEQGDEKVGEFLEKFVDKEIKQQKVFERLQEQVTEDALPQGEQIIERLEQVQEQNSKIVGEALTKIEDNPEVLGQVFDRALQKQRGSEFKDLRNLQMLEELEERVPEQAREAIQRAQENALKRFAEDVKDLSEEARTEGLERYARHIGGDEVQHIQIFDRLKQIDGLPPEMLQKMEEAKDIFATRFQERLQNIDAQFEDGELRERVRERALRQFDQVQGEDIEKLRAVEEIRRRVRFEDPELQQKVEERHSQAIEKFQQTFSDPESAEQSEKFRELTKKMAENPDPTTFRLIQELEERVKSDPKKREFVERMEQEAKAEFAERAQKMKEKFFEQISSTNPEDAEIFKKLQQDFVENPSDFMRPMGGEPGMPEEPPVGFGPPPELRQFFEQAIEKQREFVEQRREMREGGGAGSEGQDPGFRLEEMKIRRLDQNISPEQGFVCDEACQREQKQRLEEMRERLEEEKDRLKPGQETFFEERKEQVRREIEEKMENRGEGAEKFDVRPEFKREQPSFENGSGEFRPEKMPEFRQENMEGLRREFREEARGEVREEFRERVQEFREDRQNIHFGSRGEGGPGLEGQRGPGPQPSPPEPSLDSTQPQPQTTQE